MSTALPRRAIPMRRRILPDLDRPRQVFSNLTPNWYASVMGTGIVATAAASLPVHVPGLTVVGMLAWALAAVLLVALTAATALHWRYYRETARRHHHDPVMAHFYGAPPMAVLTVGAGTLLLGKHALGLPLAVEIDWVLWFAGTIAGLLTATVVPYLHFVRRTVDRRDAFGGWLMPVVAPMVSASTGALLIPYAPAGAVRVALLIACYAMFAFSLIASAPVIALIWRRVAAHDVGPARMVPTVWIVLGPLGQSITAVNLLGGVAAQTVPEPYAGALRAFAVGYGVPVWMAAVGWAGIASAITIRAAREHLPFSLTWWSFTFPVGTLVTGTSGLALHTGAALFRWAAGVLYVALLLAWVTVAVRTARGGLHGRLFLPAPAGMMVPSTDGEGACT